jgi:hypothetical protein
MARRGADGSYCIKLLLPRLHFPTRPTRAMCWTYIASTLSHYIDAWPNQVYPGAATRRNCARGKNAWTSGPRS